MNTNNDTTVGLYINGKQAEKTLEILQKEADTLGKQLEEAVRRGDKAAQKQLNKSLKDVNQTIKQIQSSTKNVADVMARLDKATPHELRKTLTTLNQQLKHIERGTPAWDAHVAKIRTVKAELDKVNAEMRQSESLLVRMKNKINDWGAMAAGAVAAFSGVVMAGKKAVNTYAEMQQEEANVRKYTGMTEEEVTHLNDAFKKMDTRTSREELNKLAQEAGRLGLQSEEDVLGFVKAADKINVALDDLGEGATLTLSKLTDIFGDKQRLGVEQSLLSVGSVINELSQNSTASAPYLAEFAQRLAGVGAQAHMTIPEIMGFGAVLDSQGQKLEMSSTALSKVIMNMFKDPAKIAEATGLSIEKFSETCKRSTNEGLLMLLERLNELGGIDSLAPVFKDMGENGARASAVLAALAGNVDMVRQQQEAANVAFQEAVSIDKEFEVQNTTVQAGLEKARKKFNEMAVELGQKLMPVVRLFHSSLSYTMKALSITIDFVVKYRKVIVTAAAAVAAYTVVAKAAKIAEVAWTLAKKAATAAQLAFNAAVRANPLGLLVGGIVAAGTAIYNYAKGTKDATEEVKKYNEAEERRKKVLKEVSDYENEFETAYAEEAGKIKSLTMIVNDNTISIDKRKEALIELKKIIPEYHAELTSEGKLIKNNTEALDAYYMALKKRIRQEKSQEKLSATASSQVEVEIKIENQQEAVKAAEDKFNQVQQKMNKLFEGSDDWSDEKYDKVYYSAEKKRLDEQWDKARHQILVEQGKLDQLKKEWEHFENVAKEVQDADRKWEESQKVKDSGNEQDVKKEKRFSQKEQVDEWKKESEAILKAKLAQGKIDSETYQTAMLELERDYQANLMSVIYAGSADYKAANAARLAAVKKLEESDVKDRYNRLKVAEQTKYFLGQTSHKEYTRKMLELDMLEKEARMNLYTEGTSDYLAAQAAYLEAKKKLKQEETKVALEEEKKGYEDTKTIIQQSYADGKLTNRAYHLALEKAELDHLQAVVNAYEKGSEERLNAEQTYAKRSAEIQRKHVEDAHKLQDQLRKEYFKNVGGITADEQGSYEEEKLQLEAVRQIMMAQATADQKLQIEEAYQKAKYELAKKYNDEAGMMAVNAAQASVDKVLEYMKTDGFQGFYQSFSTLVSGMGEIFSGLSDLIDAEVTLQEQKINKKYDAEIAAAGNNKNKIAQIEAEKEKEIAQMKNEAEEKKYGMQIASTIAQTAISAVNAYSSAAAIPIVGWIMGPIAAAMAVAAGGIQLATLKKQHEAAMAQGYAAGGYTAPGGKYQPAGIVHAGEWVASQELLANPTAAATIAQLDQAQRTNTIGQLSKPAPVVSSANDRTSGGIMTGDNGYQAPGVNVGESLDRLNKTLDGGIYAATLMTGDKGIVRAQRRYNQLMKNKSAK